MALRSIRHRSWRLDPRLTALDRLSLASIEGIYGPRRADEDVAVLERAVTMPRRRPRALVQGAVLAAVAFVLLVQSGVGAGPRALASEAESAVEFRLHPVAVPWERLAVKCREHRPELTEAAAQAAAQDVFRRPPEQLLVLIDAELDADTAAAWPVACANLTRP